MIDIQLRSCPFCGGIPWIECNERADTVWVECRDCHAKSRQAKIINSYDTPVFPNMDEAASFVAGAWGRTPANPAG